MITHRIPGAGLVDGHSFQSPAYLRILSFLLHPHIDCIHNMEYGNRNDNRKETINKDGKSMVQISLLLHL